MLLYDIFGLKANESKLTFIEMNTRTKKKKHINAKLEMGDLQITFSILKSSKFISDLEIEGGGHAAPPQVHSAGEVFERWYGEALTL